MSGRFPRPRLGSPVHLLAAGFGSGLAPRAPGTCGTLAAVPIYLLMARLELPLYLIAVAGLAALGIWLCGRTARELGVHDHPAIVFDEIVGLLVTLIGAPLGVVPLLLGFSLFRVFDILKPWPIGFLDRRVAGGLGIMLDDLVAGMMGLALLHAAVWPWF